MAGGTGASISRQRTVIWVLAVVLIVGLGIYWLTFRQQAGALDGESVSATPAAAPVEVRRGDITPVISLKASVTASPLFTVSNPDAGTVTPAAVQPGQVVEAGATLFTSGEKAVTAPARCEVSKWLQSGANLPAGLPIIECKYPGFVLAASLDASSAYTTLTGTLGAKGLLTNGPGPFDCTPLQASRGEGSGTDAATQAQQPISIMCAMPPELRGVDGASGLVALRAEQVSDAILVPRTAVMGSQDNGVVGLIRDGNTVATRVELGATDGNLIQVTSGLNAGDTISAVPPALESQ